MHPLFVSAGARAAVFVLAGVASGRRLKLGGLDAYAFLKASNIGDKLAYSATSIQTVRGLSPLPGRALKAGLRVVF